MDQDLSQRPRTLLKMDEQHPCRSSIMAKQRREFRTREVREVEEY